MRAFLCGIGAVLLLAGAPASAQPHTIRWSRLETAPGVETIPPSAIGPLAGTADQFIYKSLRWRTLEKGSAMLNLRTGFLAFRVEGLCLAQQLGGLPIGAFIGGDVEQAKVKGTIVCLAMHPGSVLLVDTPTVFLDEHGSGSFEGFVSLPLQCADAPGEILFLLRHDNPGVAIDNLYFVYGAGPLIR